VGCSYTSLSFVRGLSPWLDRRPRQAVGMFIAGSLLFFLTVGRPVRLLVLAGGLNGLVLPVTLGVVLLAARRRDLTGGYRHPRVLLAAGWAAWLVTLGAGVLALRSLSG
jgi:Mn2+/Fe2+ NRAMP family transporter